MNDFRAAPESLIQQEIAAAERVIRSGWFVLGKELKDFERNWAKVCSTKFSVGVGNGMDAIEVGLRAIGIGPGDEVITTAMTAFATVLAILRAGAIPVLADIDSSTALLSLESVKRCLSTKTKAILLVHLYGQLSEMEQWVDLCNRTQIHLLEDCAQAHLANHSGKAAGSFGTWGAYSFYPTKNLGALGDAGALVTQSKEIAQHAQCLRNYGQSKRYHHPEIGINSRLDEMQAALLSVRITWLQKYTSRRQEIANKYHQNLYNSHIELLPPPKDKASHVYHLFVMRCQSPQHFIEYLKQQNVIALQHYPVPIHHQPPCKDIRRDPKGLKNVEQHAIQCVSIPCHPHLIDEDIDRVIHAVNNYEP
ncbi:MAG: DegT/DnrJ/EryC1/StrS family aminotransferase [Cyanobacteria bacterium J06649_11]